MLSSCADNRSGRTSLRRLATRLCALSLGTLLSIATAQEVPPRQPSASTQDELPATLLTLPHSNTKTPLMQPPYPEHCRRMHHVGLVYMLVQVREDGTVAQARVMASSGDDDVDLSSAKIAMTWRLTPGTMNGFPTSMWGLFVTTFSLEGVSKPVPGAQHLAVKKMSDDYKAQLRAEAERGILSD
jgi:TonB family protein